LRRKHDPLEEEKMRRREREKGRRRDCNLLDGSNQLRDICLVGGLGELELLVQNAEDTWTRCKQSRKRREKEGEGRRENSQLREREKEKRGNKETEEGGATWGLDAVNQFDDWSVVAEGHKGPVDTFLLVLLLLLLEDERVELMLQLLVGVVDAKLLEAAVSEWESEIREGMDAMEREGVQREETREEREERTPVDQEVLKAENIQNG
jgi:hypothetical protein